MLIFLAHRIRDSQKITLSICFFQFAYPSLGSNFLTVNRLLFLTFQNVGLGKIPVQLCIISYLYLRTSSCIAQVTGVIKVLRSVMRNIKADSPQASLLNCWQQQVLLRLAAVPLRCMPTALVTFPYLILLEAMAEPDGAENSLHRKFTSYDHCQLHLLI